MNQPFVSLHNHTEYSFLDGAIRISDLVKKAKEFGMPAVAITDHGGLFGAVEFYEACVAEGIKPIIGFEAYVAPGSRFDKTQINKDKKVKAIEAPGAADKSGLFNADELGAVGAVEAAAIDKNDRYYCHLILLAANDTGWKNLMMLSTIGYTEGFYYKPRIDMEVLRKYGEGIIATSACVAGAIPQAILRGDLDTARELTREYISIFGEGNFYFELQDHGLSDEKIAMKGLIELGREMGVPFITANDAHYLRREDAPSHEVLLCIGTQDTLDNPNHYRFSSDQIYFKSPEEMAKLFPEIPEAMTNTLDIAERCNVNIKKKPMLPSIEVPKEFETPEDYLSHLAREGIKGKYSQITRELEDRLEYELGVINGMGFASYFLIVRDFVRVAGDMGIMVGCRGSAAGSLVAYVIGITSVDPIKYDLIFERFLNPERISMPDADIDFADRDRYKIIDYVVDKYGRDSVCQIINFGSMMAKMVVKDVARTMGISVGEAKRLSDMITEKTLQRSLAVNDELAKTINDNEQYQDVFKHAMVLEGLTRQPGMHAAGVIISDEKVSDLAPLFKQSNSDIIMTQFDMKSVEKVGLVKMDFLGLRTLTVLQDTQRLIKKYHDTELDLWKLPEDDQDTFKIYGNGETTGVFQVESGGMKDNMRKLKPTSIEDIIAMVALYRPGPMANIDMFINRKHGREKIAYPHPLLEDILNVTYGVIVYQEQVMRIAQVMGGFSLAQADNLRKAMGKKDAKSMQESCDKFIEAAIAQKFDRKTVLKVADLLKQFAEYGFNKAHATVYAHLSYQTAYLKTHYPLEYMTAYLGAYLGDMDEFLKMRNEAERLGIRMLAPDINKSDYEFSIDDGSIRIGLAAVKNVGKAAESILDARREKKLFTSIFDLCKSTDNRIVNKKALESLICAGAFDGFNGSRSQHFEAVASALEYGGSSQKERASGLVNLFDDLLSSGGDAGCISAPEPPLPRVMPWPLNIQLQKEKEILGFYTSGHPIDQYKDDIAAFATADIASEEFKNIKDGKPITVGGLITTVKPHVQKNGKKMAFITLEALDASIEAIVFAEAFDRCNDVLLPNNMVLASGVVMNKDEPKPKLRLENCLHLSLARSTYAKSVHIDISTAGTDKRIIDDIRKCCGDFPGDCYLVMHITTTDNNAYKIRSGNIRISPTNEAINRLRDLVGNENVRIGKSIT